jgi:hypothetical protein
MMSSVVDVFVKTKPAVTRMRITAIKTVFMRIGLTV